MTWRVSCTVLAMGLLILACTSPPTQSALPEPERTCSTVLDWHGIRPGQSSRSDVIKNLGQPSQIDSQKFYDGRDIPFLAYSVTGGRVSQFIQDRVFFRSDGVVEWIEEIVADRDGTFHAVQEPISRLGNTLDTAYLNNNYRPSVEQFDILGGPDQLYIWSECGVALDVVKTCVVSKQGCLAEETKSRNDITPTLTIRYAPPRPQRESSLGTDKIVLMRFLFPPTSYKGFKEFYMYRIPFGLWLEYLPSLRE